MRNTSRIKFSHRICFSLLLQLASISALPVTDLNHIDDINSTKLTGTNHDSLPQSSSFDRQILPTGSYGAANDAALPRDNWQRPDKVMTLAPIDDVSRMLLSNLLSPSLPAQPYYGSVLPVPLVDTRWLYNGNVKIKPSQDAYVDQNFDGERGDADVRSSGTPTVSFPIIFSQSYGSHTSAKPKQSGFAAAVGEENSDAVKQTSQEPTGPEAHQDNRALTGNQRDKPRRHRVDVEKLEEMKMEWTGGRGHSRTITSASADLMLYTPEDAKHHHVTNTTFSFPQIVPTAIVEKVLNNSQGLRNNETLNGAGSPEDEIKTLQQSAVNVGDVPEVAGGKSGERKLTPGRLMASYKSADEGPIADSEVITGDTPNVEEIGTVKEDSVYPVVLATTPADISYALTSGGKQEASSRPMSGGQPLKSTSEPLQLLPDEIRRPPADEITLLLTPSPDDLSIPIREENGNEIVEPDMDSAAASSEYDQNNSLNKGDVTIADSHVTVGSVESSSIEKTEIEPSVDTADVAEQTNDASPMKMIYRTVTPQPVRYMAGQDLLKSVPYSDHVVSTPLPATVKGNTILLTAMDGGTRENVDDVTRNSIDNDDVTEERQDESQEPSQEGLIVNSEPARHEKTVTKYHGHSSADDKGPTHERPDEKTFAMDSPKPDVKNVQLAPHEQRGDADLQQASSLAPLSPDTVTAESADKTDHGQKKSFVVPYVGKETHSAKNMTSTKPLNNSDDYSDITNRSVGQTTKSIHEDSLHVKSDEKKLTESVDNINKTNTDQQTLVTSNGTNAGLEETTNSTSSMGNTETASEFAVDDSFRQGGHFDNGNSSEEKMQSISVDDLKRKSEEIVEATTAAQKQFTLVLDHTSSYHEAASTSSPYSEHVIDYRETTTENTVDHSTSHRTYSTLGIDNTLHDVNASSPDDVANTGSNTSVLSTVDRTANDITFSSLSPPLSTDTKSGNVSVQIAPLDLNPANVHDDATTRLIEPVAVQRVHHERVAKHQSPVDSLIVGFDRHVEYSSKATEQEGNQLSATTTTVAAGLQLMTEENDNGRMLPSSKIQNPQQYQSKNEASVALSAPGRKANDTNSGEDLQSISSRLLQTTSADMPLTATFFDEASKKVDGGSTAQTTTVPPNEFETTSCSTPNYNDAITSSDLLPNFDVTSSPMQTDHLQTMIASNSVMTADDRQQKGSNRMQNKETTGDRFTDVAGDLAEKLTDDRHHNPIQQQQQQHQQPHEQKQFPITPKSTDKSNPDSEHHTLQHGLTSDNESVVDDGLSSSVAIVNDSTTAAGYTSNVTSPSISTTTSDNTTNAISEKIETKISGPGQVTTERYNVEAVQLMDLARSDVIKSAPTTFSYGNNVETEPNVDQSSFNSIVDALVTLLVDEASSSSTPETSTPTAVTSQIGSATEEHHDNNVTPPQATLNNDLGLSYSNQQSSATITWSTTPDSSNYSDPLPLEVAELSGQKAPINLEMTPDVSAKANDSASEQVIPPSPPSFIQSSTSSTETVEFLSGTTLLNDNAQTTSTSSTIALNGDERRLLDDHSNSSWAQVDTEVQLTTRGSSVPSAEASLSGGSALSGISTPTSTLTRPWLIGLIATAGVCVFVFVAVLSFLAVYCYSRRHSTCYRLSSRRRDRNMTSSNPAAATGSRLVPGSGGRTRPLRHQHQPTELSDSFEFRRKTLIRYVDDDLPKACSAATRLRNLSSRTLPVGRNDVMI